MHYSIKLFTLLFSITLISSNTFASSSLNFNNTIFSILSYAKWQTSPPSICVINNTSLANDLKNDLSDPNRYQISAISSNEIKKSNCQVLIFSTLPAKEEQDILNTSVRFPALSISLNNLECEEGSAFCLYKKNNNVNFKINLNTLTQSKIHIDPRVLMLAKSTGENK